MRSVTMIKLDLPSEVIISASLGSIGDPFQLLFPVCIRIETGKEARARTEERKAKKRSDENRRKNRKERRK